jgi:hypothetical protein
MSGEMNTDDKSRNYDRGIVYTAIFGEAGDRLRPYPIQRNPELGFLAFLEDTQIIEAGTRGTANWETAGARFDGKSSRRQARAHKILSHRLFKTASYTLWIDGALQIIDDDMQSTMEKHLKGADICVFRHRKRRCVYDEVFACIEQQKDDKITMIDQVARYLKDDYPRNNGLAETGVLLRRNCESVSALNEMWWGEIEKGSHRDQLSFDYVAWKLGIKYNIFPGTTDDNPYFKWLKH